MTPHGPWDVISINSPMGQWNDSIAMYIMETVFQIVCNESKLYITYYSSLNSISNTIEIAMYHE